MNEPQDALYSVGRLPFLADLATNLETANGWRPAYWITQPELEEAVAQRYPRAIRHDFTDANRGVNDPVGAADRPLLDPDLLLRDGHLLRTGIEIVARHVLGSAMTPDQQADFFLERLDYAVGVTRALDLQVFVLNSTPHSVIDFAFYAAFRLLQRKVRILHLTGFRGLQVIVGDATATAPLGLETLGQVGEVDLSAESRTELERLMDTREDLTPWYVTQQNARTEGHARYYAAADVVLDEGRYAPGHVDFEAAPMRGVPDRTPSASAPKPPGLRGLFRRSDPPAPPVDPGPLYEDAFKRRFQPKHDLPMRRAFAWRSEGFGAAPITWRQYYMYRDWVLLTKRRWERDYARLSGGLDVEQATAGPYAFFALHYQPERTSCPEGGIYSDQLLALRTVVRALPEGWRLLVKEHPSQFLWQTEGELGRWDGYYDRIRELGPVDLVPLDVSSERLIRRAKAVATVTGTVGWEAAVRGVPTVVLAQPWYAAPGVVLTARNGPDLADAFARIAAGWRPEPTAIAEHLARLERLGRRCFLNPSHAPLYGEMTDEENLAGLTDLFVSTECRLQAAA